MDWRAYVRSQLPPLDLEPHREADIVEELAQQHEQTYEAAIASGQAPAQAWTAATGTVPDWRALAGEIRRAERSLASRAASASVAPLAAEPAGAGAIAALWRDLLQDVRHAGRVLARHRAFTGTAVLTLALAIGANSAIFSLVHGILLKPLPFPEADRLVWVTESIPALGAREIPFSPPDLLDYRAAQTSFEAMSAFQGARYELSGAGGGTRVNAIRAEPELFDVLGVVPALGRAFTKDDAAQDVGVVSHGMWQAEFGGDPALVGRTVLLDRRPVTVVGVMPPGFVFPPAGMRYGGLPADVFVPLVFTSEQIAGRGSNFAHSVIARMKPDVAVSQAQAEAGAIISAIEQRYPTEVAAMLNGSLTASVKTFHEEVVGSRRPMLLAMFGTVAVLLLIGCANVGNLLLLLSAARRRELTVRASLGAGRGRIVRQLLAESIVLAVVGGGAGLLLAKGLVTAAPMLLPDDMPRLHELSLDGTVVAFTAMVSLVTAIVFGLAPGLQASRVDLRTVLADAGRGSTSGSGRRLRSVLVVAQCALALVLLVSAGLLGRSLTALVGTDPGFKPDSLVIASTFLPEGGYASPSDVRTFYRNTLARLAQIPGAVHGGISTDLPMFATEMRAVTLPGSESVSADAPPAVVHSWVAGEYLQALGVPLLAGRHLTDGDTERTQPVAVISKAMADRFWPGQDPIGRQFRTSSEDPVFTTVVGVVGDVKDGELDRPARPHSYSTLWQVPDEWLAAGPASVLFRSPQVVVSSVGDLAPVTRTLRTMLREVDAQLAFEQIGPFEAAFARRVAEPRFAAVIIGAFALTALLLAAIGLHGVLAYSVSQRTQEIGIRVALGASAADVARMVFGDGLRLAGLGLVVGVAMSLAVSRLLASLLYGVTPTDPATFGAVSVLLLAVAALAIWLPARQAIRVDPAAAIKDA